MCCREVNHWNSANENVTTTVVAHMFLSKNRLMSAHLFALGVLATLFPVVVRAELLCAVIPTSDDATLAHIATLVESQMPEDVEIALVNRADFQRILEEKSLHQLHIAAAVGERHRTGNSLNAELLLLVSPGVRAGVIEFTIVEVKSGLRLIHNALAATDEDAIGAFTKTYVRFAFHKLSEKLERVVAVPPFSCDNLTYEFAPLMQAYAESLAGILQQTPGTRVVELEEAIALGKEIAISPAESLNRTLPYYFMGKFKRYPNGKSDVAIELRIDKKTKSRVAATVENDSGIKAFFENSLIELLDGANVMSTEIRPEHGVEAELLTMRADHFRILGEDLAAITLYESALLLEPGRNDARIRIIELLIRRIKNTRLSSHDQTYDAELCNRLARTVFRYHIRGLEHIEYLIRGETEREPACKLWVRFGWAMHSIVSRQISNHVQQHPETNELAKSLMRRQYRLQELVCRTVRMKPVQLQRVKDSGSLLRHISESLDLSEFVHDFARILRAMETQDNSFEHMLSMLAGFQNREDVFRLIESSGEDCSRVRLLPNACRLRLGMAGKGTPDFKQLLEELTEEVSRCSFSDRTLTRQMKDFRDYVKKQERRRERNKDAGPRSRHPRSPKLAIGSEPGQRLAWTRLDLKVGRHEPKLNGWLDCGPQLDCTCDSKEIYKMTAPGCLESVVRFGKSDGVKMLYPLAWDGAYAWFFMWGESFRICAVDLTDSSVFIFDEDDGLPPIDGGRVATAVKPGTICVIGSFGRTWVGLLSVRRGSTSTIQKNIEVIAEFRVQVDPQDIWNGNPNVAFNPSFAACVTDPADPDHQIVIVGRNSWGMRRRPVVVDLQSKQFRLAKGEIYTTKVATRGASLFAIQEDGFYESRFPDFEVKKIADLKHDRQSRVHFFQTILVAGRFHSVGTGHGQAKRWISIDANTLEVDQIELDPRIHPSPVGFYHSGHFGLIGGYSPSVSNGAPGGMYTLNYSPLPTEP